MSMQRHHCMNLLIPNGTNQLQTLSIDGVDNSRLLNGKSFCALYSRGGGHHTELACRSFIELANVIYIYIATKEGSKKVMSHRLCSFNKVQQNDIHSNYSNKPTNNCSLIGKVKVACQANKPRGQSGFQLSKIRSHIRLSLPTAEQNGMPNRRNTIKHNIIHTFMP